MIRPRVTREVVTTIAQCLVFDKDYNTAKDMELKAPRTYKTKAALLKRLQSMYNNGCQIVLEVKTYRCEKKRYAMLEEDFIKHAKEIEPRKAKEEK